MSQQEPAVVSPVGFKVEPVEGDDRKAGNNAQDHKQRPDSRPGGVGSAHHQADRDQDGQDADHHPDQQDFGSVEDDGKKQEVDHSQGGHCTEQPHEPLPAAYGEEGNRDQQKNYQEFPVASDLLQDDPVDLPVVREHPGGKLTSLPEGIVVPGVTPLVLLHPVDLPGEPTAQNFDLHHDRSLPGGLLRGFQHVDDAKAHVLLEFLSFAGPGEADESGEKNQEEKSLDRKERIPTGGTR